MKPQATVSHIVTLFFLLSIRNKGTESVSLTDENILGASDSTLPSFVTGSNNTLVTSVGQTIYLYCGVNNLGDRQVTWLRSRDLTILTIGLVRYTRDQRFTAIHGQEAIVHGSTSNWAYFPWKYRYVHNRTIGSVQYCTGVSTNEKPALVPSVNQLLPKKTNPKTASRGPAPCTGR